jgi:hypothetical protein
VGLVGPVASFLLPLAAVLAQVVVVVVVVVPTR